MTFHVVMRPRVVFSTSLTHAIIKDLAFLSAGVLLHSLHIANGGLRPGGLMI